MYVRTFGPQRFGTDIKTGEELMIIPETDFEVDYLKQFQGKKLEAFVKTGQDLTDIVGLKIRIQPADKGVI